MHNRFTRIIAWATSVGTALAFAMPAGAIEFFSTPFRYQWKSQSGTIEGDAHVVRANAGDTVAMSLTLTNRSIDSRARVIYGKSTLLAEASPYQGAHELRIGTANPHDRSYDWVDSSSFIANPDGAANRLAVYDGAAVNPGGDVTLAWNLKIASTAANGTYDFYVGVVREFDTWARQVDSAGRLLPSEDIFFRVIIGGGVIAPAGALNVALSSQTPAAASIADAGNANFTKITLTAAAGTTVKISQIFVTRDGLSADTDVENVKLLTADGVQVGGTAGGFNANHQAQIFITPAHELTGSKDYFIRAGIVDTTTAGKTIRLGIAASADIISNATSISGAPVYGNYMTVVQVDIGSLTVAEDGAVVDSTPDVGDTDVITNTFKMTAGSVEPITIDRITVLKAGTSEVSDTTNIELWDVTNNKTLGTAANWTADGKASWPVNIALGKGDNLRLRVQLDVVDGVGLTVNTDLLDGSDTLVFAKGDSYGFYITPTSGDANWSNTNNGQGANVQTINSGSLTISKSGSTPATGNIAVADNQLLAVYDFDVRGESVRISAVHTAVVITDANGSTAVTYADLTNARLVDIATGNILSGPVDGTTGTSDTDEMFDFTNTFVLPVGVTKVGFKVRLGTDFENNDTLVGSIEAAASVTAKGIITNNSITPGGTYAITGNTQTVKAGALVVETLGIPATSNIVINSQDMIIGTYSFNAVASGEDVTVSVFTITDDVDATTGETDDFSNMELWADLTSANSSRGDAYETKISNTEQPDNNAAGTDDTLAFTLTTVLEIPKGTFRKVALIADVVAGATALGTHIIETASATFATATGKSTGSDIAESAAGLSTNATLTIATVGTVTSALAGANPTESIVIAGSTADSTLAAFRITAADEAFNITKLSFTVTGWASLDTLKIAYPTQTGTTSSEVAVSSTAVVYDNITMYVGKNASAVITVSGKAKRIQTGTGGTFRDSLAIVLDTNADADFVATGANSGTALDGGDIADQTANTHILYNSVPTVTAANPSTSGTIQPGQVLNLFKFRVTADAAGDVSIKKFTFTIFITDASTTTASDADLSLFTFSRAGTDITSSAQITDITTSTPVTLEATNYIENNISTTVQVIFGQTPTTDNVEQTVGYGQTVEYLLRAKAGTGFTTTDAISISMEGDTTLPTASATYLSDSDTGTGVEQIVTLQLANGTQDNADVEFIWSDRSVLAHAATFDDDGVTETSSADWTNGYLIKNFPVDSYGFTL